MDVSLAEQLLEAVAAVDKCLRELEEMGRIEAGRGALQEKFIDSALSESAGADNASKQALGLEKVLESMQEKLEKEMAELGKKMLELKAEYSRKAEGAGTGSIREAVPE